MKIFPVEDNIYYEWLPVSDRIGSILLSERHEQRTREAVVHEVGPKCKTIEKGDKILISAFTGAHLFLISDSSYKDGEKHRICRETEVLAKYEE